MHGITATLAIASLFTFSTLQAESGDTFARARIVSCLDPSQSLGNAYLRERASEEGVKEVDVTIRMRRGTLTLGKHAVHIHETAACTPCSAAGGHFDPGPESNTSPDGNHPFHSGDLININAVGSGPAISFTTTSRITLSPGPLSVLDEDGSAIIIHDFEDSYCQEGEVAGCAGGSRAACGIIRLQ